MVRAVWLASGLLCVKIARVEGQDCLTGNAYDAEAGQGQCDAIIVAGLGACDPDFSFGGQYAAL